SGAGRGPGGDREPHLDAAGARLVPGGCGPRLAFRSPIAHRMARMPGRSPRHSTRSKVPFSILLLGLGVVAGAVTLWQAWGAGGDDRADGASPSTQPSASESPTPGATGSTAAPSPSGVPTPGPINTAFPGITTFRGNATRDYYGEGPVPMHPVIRWNYPESGALCSTSADAAARASGAGR